MAAGPDDSATTPDPVVDPEESDVATVGTQRLADPRGDDPPPEEPVAAPPASVVPPDATVMPAQPFPTTGGLAPQVDPVVSSPDTAAPTTSPWPIIGWLLFAVSMLVVGIAASTGLLMPAVVLDIASFWPAWVVALLVALTLWPLRRRGIARIGAVLPLLLFSWITAAVGLHLLEWDQLPSSAADIRGPSGAGVTTAQIGIEVSGALTLGGESETLYDVRLVRSGGDAGPPDALERLVPSSAVIQLQERSGAGWFRSSGWTVALQRGPAWEITVVAGKVDISTRGLALRALAVAGDGAVRIGTPSVDTRIVLDGDLTLTVPAGTAVSVVGAAGVPPGWETTDEGARSNGTGAVVTVEVADGSVARISEG